MTNSEVVRAIVPKNFEDLETGAEECAICLQKFGQEEQADLLKGLVVQLDCHKDHVFHEKCLTQFIRSNSADQNNCPLCKRHIKENKKKKDN